MVDDTQRVHLFEGCHAATHNMGQRFAGQGVLACEHAGISCETCQPENGQRASCTLKAGLTALTPSHTPSPDTQAAAEKDNSVRAYLNKVELSSKSSKDFRLPIDEAGNQNGNRVLQTVLLWMLNSAGLLRCCC